MAKDEQAVVVGGEPTEPGRVDRLDRPGTTASHDEGRLLDGAVQLEEEARGVGRLGRPDCFRERPATVFGDERGDGDGPQPMQEAVEEEEEEDERDDDEPAGDRHGDVGHRVALDVAEEPERERQRADQHREQQLEQAVAVPEPHVASRERRRRHLHDENAHGQHEPGERGHRADDRGQQRRRGRWGVLPEGRNVPGAVGKRAELAEHCSGDRAD